MKKYNLLNCFALVLIMSAIFLIPSVYAEIDFDGEISGEEQAQFDEILSPVMKIYNFVKYAATVAGVLMLVFAGISFVTSGGEQIKKEKAKNMAAGVIIGLIVIWVAPLIVNVIFS